MANFRYKFPPGTLINGQYRVEQRFEGGMSEVYQCRDEFNEGSFVAIKTPKPEYLHDMEEQERFNKEAYVWVTLGRHTNIVYCQGLDTLEISDEGQNNNNAPYMLLEWISPESGRKPDLRGWLESGRLDVRTTLDILLDVCRGMIHVAGVQQDRNRVIVHLDLKPDNVLIAPGRVAKITDFGMGHMLDIRNLKRQSIRRGGTFKYMAPEQWLSETVSVPTDVYAFGCMMYEMLTGAVPFTGRHEALKQGHLKGEPDLSPVPKQLKNVVARCLQKEPDRRYASFQEIYDTLHSVYIDMFNQQPAQRVQSQNFTSEEHINRAVTYFRLESYEDALKDIDAALAITPGNPYLVAYKGFAYSHLKQHDEAMGYLEQALDTFPDSSQINYMLGMSHYNAEHYEESLPYFDQAYEMDPTLLMALYYRGLALGNLGRIEESLRDVTQIIREKPKHPDLYYFRALLYEANEQYTNALEDLTRTLELSPNYYVAHLRRAELYYEIFQRPAQALQNLRDHNAIYPDNPEAWIRTGVICRVLGLYEEAIPAYTNAIRLQNEEALLYCWRARAYLGNKQHQLALEDCEKAIELDPQAGLPYSVRGMVYNDMGRHDEALEDFTKSARLDPEDTSHIRGKSVVYADTNSFELGLDEANKLIIHSPDEKWAYYVRAYFLRRLKRYDEALDDLNAALQQDPSFHYAVIARGEIYLKMGKYSKAADDFEGMRRRNPRSFEALQGMGQVREHQEAYHEALRYYHRAAELGSPAAAHYYNKLCKKLGRPGLDFDPLERLYKAVIYARSAADMRQDVREMPYLIEDAFLAYLSERIFLTNNQRMAQQIRRNLRILKTIAIGYRR
jgi:tetratricopeptide (TPR) repeat protein